MTLRGCNKLRLVALVALAAFAFGGGPAKAATLLSDFSNFGLSGTYVQWDSGTFTSGATDYQVETTDFGGGWYDLPAVVDATGETAVELQLDVNTPNVADKFNVVLIDGDGTERVFRFDGVAAGDDQTLTVNLADYLQDNVPGSTPGLDISNLTTFHLQGTFENGEPGAVMDLTFDNLALTNPVPEPTALAALALCGIAAVIRVRRR